MALSTHPCQGRGEEAGAYPRVHPGQAPAKWTGHFHTCGQFRAAN